MRTSILSAITLTLLAASAAAGAAGASGHYYNQLTSETKTTLPNGNTAILSHFSQITVTDNANDPMDHLAGSCSGQTIVSKEGKTLSSSGICFLKDTQGNSLTNWWKLDEDGTANCPDGCGNHGILSGTGKFKGLTGGGTWKRTYTFGDVASSGTFTQTSSKP